MNKNQLKNILRQAYIAGGIYYTKGNHKATAHVKAESFDAWFKSNSDMIDAKLDNVQDGTTNNCNIPIVSNNEVSVGLPHCPNKTTAKVKCEWLGKTCWLCKPTDY